MSGIVEHHKACKRVGVKPIYGMEVTTSDGYHLTLLAKNDEGLTNLFRLCQSDKTYARLKSCSSGVIALSGDLSAAIPVSILRKDVESLNFHLRALTNIYDDFYLEIIDHGLREQKIVNRYLQKLSRNLDIKTVKTNDIHYLTPDQARTQTVLMCDFLKKRCNYEWLDYHINKQAIPVDLGDNPVAQEIAEMCNVELDLHKVLMPKFSDGDEAQLLRDLVQDSIWHRCPRTAEYKERVEYELSVIERMGYSGYFLIVADFIWFAHKNGIPVGPGRGSGAGSLVAYILRITDLDPIKYNLLFERFLNPDRISLPDFDIDFSQSRRDEVIQYVIDKYSEERVCQIATFSELKPRSAWKSASRVMRLDINESERISKLLPEPPGDSESLSDIVEDGFIKPDAPEKYHVLNKVLDEKSSVILDEASKLEGAYRAVGRHAAGVLISNEPLGGVIPTWSKHTDNFPIKTDEFTTRYISQLQHTDAEKMGLVKFDFLGLKELDVIQYCLDNIYEETGEEIDMNSIPLDDAKTFEMISKGQTLGMFQVSSDGMAQMVKEMGASEFEDIVAAVALYRPGPMDAGMDQVYIRRKNDLEPVEYLHPDLQPILETTYGIIVYQEQVMQIAQTICGYSLGEADILRRAMGKKKAKEMASQKEAFMSGGLQRGYDSDLCEELWRQIETFARYGFNRSHAAAYAMITYQTAWLKANYPAYLLAAQMQMRSDSFEEVSAFVDDALSLGIEVVEPVVGRSPKNFRVENERIMLGIGSLHGINDSIAEVLDALAAKYSDLTLGEIFSKVYINKLSMDALVYSGAFDAYLDGDIHQARADLFMDSERFLSESKVRGARDTSLKPNTTQINMFDVEIELNYGQADPMDPRVLLDKEREYLGRYRTGHPAQLYRRTADSFNFDLIEDLPEDGDAKVCALVTDCHEITTRKGDLMCFLRLEDESGNTDLTVFPDDYDPNIHPDLVDEVLFIELFVGRYKGLPSPQLGKFEHAYHRRGIRR